MDNNGIVELHCQMLGAVDNSALLVYICFGFPEEDCCTACLSEEKWNELIVYAMLYLGFYIDTHLMIMALPIDKNLQLAALLDDLFACQSCIVTPLGMYLSFESSMH
jgi:hypothetical protein